MTAKRSGATATEPEQARHTARLDIDHAPSWAMLPLVPWRVGQIGSDDHLHLLRHDGFTADNIEFKSWRQFIGSSRGDMACHRSRSQCHACTGLRCCGRPATLDFWDRVSVATEPTAAEIPLKPPLYSGFLYSILYSKKAAVEASTATTPRPAAL
jgi:hypothetical protein